MAGIYIHIPFCKQACHYCDFHFSTSLSLKKKLVLAIIEEIKMQRDFLSSEKIETIYFGGGTPSLLSPAELIGILNTIKSIHAVDNNAEITLEANPDDLSITNLNIFKSSGINRLSIGVQSFHNSHLNFLNRAHDHTEAINSIKNARKVGFNNISIDLIYGIPHTNDDLWIEDVETALELDIEHISAYCLTIEDKTVFGNWLKKGKIKAIEDEYAAQQYEIMLQKFKIKGYEQYEISNFSKPEYHSRHNRNYWFQVPYLGIGPGAHSFSKKLRQYNVSNNPIYIKAITSGQIPATFDQLEPKDSINERIMISLRTKWGLDLIQLKKEYGYDLLAEQSKYVTELQSDGLAQINKNRLILNERGKLLADYISSELFIE